LVSEVVARDFREASKVGRSSRGPTTLSSAVDGRDGLHLQDQCLGWGPGKRSAPPVYDDGGLDVSGSDSDGGAPLAATTSA
jgi:hypothetical protein